MENIYENIKLYTWVEYFKKLIKMWLFCQTCHIEGLILCYSNIDQSLCSWLDFEIG